MVLCLLSAVISRDRLAGWFFLARDSLLFAAGLLHSAVFEIVTYDLVCLSTAAILVDVGELFLRFCKRRTYL